VGLEDAALDEREQGHHGFERVRAGVLPEVRVEAIGARGGDAGMGAFVEQDGDRVVLAGGPEPLIRGGAQRAASHGVGPQHDRAKAVVQRLFEIAHHGLGLVAREQRRPPKARRGGGAQIAQPPVVGQGVGARLFGVDAFVVNKKRREGRKQDGDVDAGRVHLGEVPGGGLGGGEEAPPTLAEQRGFDIGRFGDAPHDGGVAHAEGRRRRQEGMLAQALQALGQGFVGGGDGQEARRVLAHGGRQVLGPHGEGLDHVSVDV
jgi:hypothetical protein